MARARDDGDAHADVVDEAYENLAKRIGRRLRKVRREVGLTGTELGKLIGKSQAFISDVERGRKLPSLPTLMALSETLKRSPEYFMGDAEYPGELEAAAGDGALPGSPTGGYGLRLSQIVGMFLEERRLNWKDLGEHIDGGLAMALRIKQGFLPSRHIIAQIADYLEVESPPLMVAAGYLPDDAAGRQLWEVLTDAQVQTIALKIARDFPSVRAKRFVNQIVDVAKSFVDEVSEPRRIGRGL